MRGALWPIVLLVAAVGVGRFLERRYRLRNRTGSPWGEPDIQPGQEAMATFTALPGEEFPAKVGYVYPYLDERTRTAELALSDGAAVTFPPGESAR